MTLSLVTTRCPHTRITVCSLTLNWFGGLPINRPVELQDFATLVCLHLASCSSGVKSRYHLL